MRATSLLLILAIFSSLLNFTNASEDSKGKDLLCGTPLELDADSLKALMAFIEEVEALDAELAQLKADQRLKAKVKEDNLKLSTESLKLSHKSAKELFTQTRTLVLKAPSKHFRNAGQEDLFAGLKMSEVSPEKFNEVANILKFEAVMTLLYLMPEKYASQFYNYEVNSNPQFIERASAKFGTFMSHESSEKTIFHHEDHFDRKSFLELVEHFKFIGEYHKRAHSYATYVSPMNFDTNKLLSALFVQLSLNLNDNNYSTIQKQDILESLYFIKDYVQTHKDEFSDDALEDDQQMPYLLSKLFLDSYEKWKDQVNPEWIREFNLKAFPQITNPTTPLRPTEVILSASDFTTEKPITNDKEPPTLSKKTETHSKNKKPTGFALILQNLDNEHEGRKNPPAIDDPADDISQVLFKDSRIERRFQKLETQGNHIQGLIFKAIEKWKSLIEKHGWAHAHKLPEYPEDKILKSEKDTERRHRVKVGHSARLIYRVDTTLKQIIIEAILENHEYEELM
ncbi:MAG: hypothetical protein KA116_11870 [Proteobacteria bacterium]|nr:hypothetical protein [Pseudomonadota bacterium]